VLHGIILLWFLTPALVAPALMAWQQGQAAFTPAQGLAALGIVFAAFVKGVTGMGFPVIGAPIAALFLDPQTTVVAITIPAFVMNVIQAFQGGVSLALVRRLLPVFLVLVPSAIAGTIMLARVSGSILMFLLGLMITVYAVVALWRLRLVVPPAHEGWVGALTGLCSGVIGGATSIFAPPVVMYLTALQLPKAAFVSTTAVCLLVGQIPHLVSLVSLRLLTAPRLGMAALFCGLSAVGFLLGVRLQRIISQPRFAKVVLVTLLGVGLSLLHSGVMGWR
jgi:uncharacterized protein